MNSEDQTFLEKLGGPVEKGGDWKVLMRRGRALLIMPAGREGMSAGAELYSPQRKVARTANWCLRRIPSLWRLLPSVRWAVNKDAPLGRILKESSSRLEAILLGNPMQAGRRALVLAKGSSLMVLKIGVGTPAVGLVAAEGDFIEAEYQNCEEMPVLEYRGKGENWSAFGIPFLEGGDLELSCLCRILESWLGEKEIPFAELPSAERLRRSSNTHAARILEVCENLKLRPSIVHGDLAPWNIRKDGEGNPRIIDWEEGRRDDVPCWDLVHFIFQRVVLVDGLDSRATKFEVIKSLETEPAKSLLKLSGWGEKVTLLFASYLIAMATEEAHAVNILENLDYESIA